MVVSWLAGCASRAIGPAGSPVAGAPVRFELRGRLDQPDGSRVRFEAAGLWNPPGSLRIEVRGPVGGVRALVAVRGERMKVLWPGERRWFEAAATRETWERLVGLPLSSEELGTLVSDPSDEEGAGRRRLAGSGWEIRRSRSRITLIPAGSAHARFARLELTGVNVAGITPDEAPPALFDPAVPAGWARFEPGPSDAALAFAP